MAKSEHDTNLVKHTVVYGFGSALTAAGGFLLIPLYTHSLTPDQYGILELLNRVIDVVIMLSFLGTRQAFMRFYFDSEDKTSRQAVTGTTLVFSVLMCIALELFLIPLLLVAPQADTVDRFQVLVAFAAGWIPMEVIILLGMAVLQVKLKSTVYVAVSVARLVVFIGLIYVMLYIMKQGIVGVVLAQLIISGVIGGGFLWMIWRDTRFRVDRGILKALLAFGLPYLPAGMFMYVISNSDRYALGYFASLGDVGIYALAYKLGSVAVALFMVPFQKVWAPFIFSVCRDEDGPERIGRAFVVFTAITAYLALGISVLTPYILPWIADPAYQSVDLVVPIVCFGTVFYGMACLIDAGVLIEKKTHVKPLIFGTAAALGVVFQLVLTPSFGVIGAACATSLTFVALFLINHQFSERYYHVNIQVRALMVVLAAVAGCWILSSQAPSLVDSAAAILAVKVGALVAYPAVIVAARVISIEELVKVIRTRAAVAESGPLREN